MPGSCICSGLPVANCLRQLCPLGTRSLSAQASACGSRTVGCPEFIRGIQFRPLGRNSLTTFRGQTALRGCPRPRFAALTRREKALYCPFLKEGVRNVARIKVGELSPSFVRAPVLAFFRRQNRRAFFPSLPIAALLRCQLGGGGAEIVQVEMLLRRMAGLAAPKASVVLEPMLAFVASHEACRRMAVCTRQRTGNCTRPASRGTCRATAVKPRPIRMSLYAPARPRRAEAGAGL